MDSFFDFLQREAKKFLRGLISFAATLDELPGDRWYVFSAPSFLRTFLSLLALPTRLACP